MVSVAEAVAAVGASGLLDRRAIRASVERRFDVGRIVENYLALCEAIVSRHGAP